MDTTSRIRFKVNAPVLPFGAKTPAGDVRKNKGREWKRKHAIPSGFLGAPKRATCYTSLRKVTSNVLALRAKRT